MVYDKKQIQPLEWDYAAFKKPAAKLDAVVGIVRVKNASREILPALPNLVK